MAPGANDQSLILSCCRDYDEEPEDIGEGVTVPRQSERIRAAVSDYLMSSFRKQQQLENNSSLRKGVLDSALRKISI